MRIAHVVTYLDKKRSYGGPVSVAIGLAQEQVNQGDEVDLISLSNSSALESMIPNGVLGHFFVVKNKTARTKFSRLISMSALYWLLKNRNTFDIFHLHFSRDLFQVLAGLIVTSGKAKVVLQPHGMITNATRHAKAYQAIYDRLLTNRVIAKADMVIALQEIEKSALWSNFGCQSIEILPNGINFDDIRQNQIRDKKLVVFVSRLHSQKNPILFIDAATSLLAKGSNLHFEIAGPDGGLEKEVLEKVTNANLSSLKFLGSLDNFEVIELFDRAGLLVLPSIDDPYPMVVLEALSRGLPVALSSRTGVSPLIKKHNLGVTFEPGLENLEDAILKATSQKFFPEKTQQIAKQVFDVAAIVKTLRAIYVGIDGTAK